MKILIFAAHSDDIEMAMGGTLSKLLRELHEVKIVIISSAANKSGNEEIESELKNSMAIYNVGYVVHKFNTDDFMNQYHKIKDTVYQYRDTFKPDRVYCNSRNSMHTDHKVVAHACKAIFLETTVLAYQDIRGGQEVVTRWYEVIREVDISTKIKALSCYKSQIDVHKRKYFDFESIRGKAMGDGLQCGSKYAEPFEVIRVINP